MKRIAIADKARSTGNHLKSGSKQLGVDITVVIVTYNNRNEIIACLKSLAKASRDLSVHLVIIDNASQDGTLQVVDNCITDLHKEYNKVEIVTNKKNRGFTKGANQGISRRFGRLLLLLNPDTELKPNTLTKLISHLTVQPEVAIVAPQLLNPNGTIQPSCRRFPSHRDVLFELLGLGRIFPSSRVFNRWKMGDFDHLHTIEADQPQGAFLLVRSSAIEQVGILDPRLTMFFSDVDWCLRFKQQGWKILFCADSQTVHHKGVSIYNNRAQMIVQSHRDFFAYFRKNFLGTFQSSLNLIIGFLLLIIIVPRLFFREIQ